MDRVCGLSGLGCAVSISCCLLSDLLYRYVTAALKAGTPNFICTIHISQLLSLWLRRTDIAHVPLRYARHVAGLCFPPAGARTLCRIWPRLHIALGSSMALHDYYILLLAGSALGVTKLLVAL